VTSDSPSRVLGIIPARGGSKGLPRKNVIPLAGKPLLAYTIEAARGSRRLTRTILSSEDQEIRTVARRLGVGVPFVRPAELATDDASSVGVVMHALRWVEHDEAERYDFVCLLQPTSPLRTSADIDTAIDILEHSDADAIVSLTRVEEPHPVKMMVVNDDHVIQPLFPDQWRETVRRQELQPVFYLNGAVYCVRRAVLLQHSLWGHKTLAYVMPAERSVNIDSILDVRLAESLLGGQARDADGSRGRDVLPSIPSVRHAS
jgi:CMP-N,N'-diacetyllegionaminic acid synthase